MFCDAISLPLRGKSCRIAVADRLTLSLGLGLYATPWWKTKLGRRGARVPLVVAERRHALSASPNRMTAADASKAGIPDNHWLYFSVGTDKVNMAPPADSRKCFKLNSITLMNGDDGGPGDDVGVVIGWQWPVDAELPDEMVLEIQKAIDGKNFRKNVQATNWVGHSVAKVLGLDIVGGADAEHNRWLVKNTVSKLLKSGALAEARVQDESRKPRTVIVAGRGA